MENKFVVVWCFFGAIFVGFCMWAYPTYNVWQKGLEGEANLKKAQQERQILITQAQSEADASKLQAQAIETVGKMAKEYPEYRSQQFIMDFGEAMKNGSIEKIIYVPTEANIPITEASRTLSK